jgi:hypothetical protein
MTEEKMTKVDDDIRKMPETSRLMTLEEFAVWIASRKRAGAAIDIETAELKGWWSPEGDPYGLSLRALEEAPSYENSPKLSPHYFVRDPRSRGWVWQGDLPDDKRAATQARIDEHNRKVKKFYADRRAAGCLIDTETCERSWWWADDTDPYGVELAPYEQISRHSFVCNKDSDDWIRVHDLPVEKREALDRRALREHSARAQIIEDIPLLRRAGGLVAAACAIAEAERTYGKQTVRDALQDHYYPFGVIGGLLIERGYLTMEHVTELLRGKPKAEPDIPF